MENRWHAVDPFIIGFDGTGEPDAMLLHDISKWSHAAPRKIKNRSSSSFPIFFAIDYAMNEGSDPGFSSPAAKKGQPREEWRHNLRR